MLAHIAHDKNLLRAHRGPVLGVAALIAAMVADLVQTVVDPANSDKASKLYAASSHHHGRMVAAAILLLASAFLLVPGVFAVTRTLRTRGRRIGAAGAALAVLGAAGHVALATFYVVFATIPGSSLPAAQGVELLDHITHSREALVVAPLAIAFPLAILATLIATVRAGLVGRRLLVPLVAAPVVGIVAPGPDALKTCGALVLFLAAAAVLLRAASRQPASSAPATV